MASQLLDEPGRAAIRGVAGPSSTDPGGPGGGLGDTRQIGLLGFLATVSMLFLGFTSALLLRRASGDWLPLPPPPLLWLNTLALLASSVTLEAARRRIRAGDLPGCEGWAWATGALGLLFAAGQLVAWRELAAEGIYLATNPSSSFFYVLTGAHCLHLAGGIAWFLSLAVGLRRLRHAPGEDGLGLFALYWHFLGGLWLYLFLLLFAS